ncbi:MAG: hypothetical protein PHT49_01755 [Desulfovibrionales bacterium]|nr:hypothetical protein [Desulfovibrionales bacterium]
MKKGLIIIAAALFVAVMALPAMAVEVSISGYYQVRGFYQSNANQGMVTPWDGSSVPAAVDNSSPADADYTDPGDFPGTYGSPEAWWDHFLCLEPVFTITDNLKLHAAIGVFNNQMWGSDKTSGACSCAGQVGVDPFGADATNISWDAAYIEWATPKGTLMVGRMAGNYIYFTGWANTEMCLDRVEYTSPLWNGFGLNAFMEKRQESSATSGNNAADEDIDRYSLVLSYAQPCYSIGAGINYVRDRSGSATGTTWKADQYDYVLGLTANDPTNTYFFEGEIMLNDGDYTDYYGATQDIDRGGWGYYVNLGMKKEALTVGVATAFTSGDDNDSDSDYDVGPASGLDFQPLYIVYGPYGNILNSSLMDTTRKAGYSNTTGEQFGLPGTDGGANDTATGSQVYWLYADYEVNPQLAVHGALAVAYADKVNSSLYQDDEFGTEFDLGLKYQLMSNLAYELHFGYLWTGDFFKGTSANNYNTDDVYQIDHSLTLSF